MVVELLSVENFDKLAEFEKCARLSEPDVFLEELNCEKFKHETLAALQNPNYSLARCMLCAEGIEGNVIGRLDFSILSSFAFGGDMRAYIDWVYVLKEHRHKGVARFLFSHMEEYLTSIGINEYFLIAAENQEAQQFYRSIKDAHMQKQDILTNKFG